MANEENRFYAYDTVNVILLPLEILTVHSAVEGRVLPLRHNKLTFNYINVKKVDIFERIKNDAGGPIGRYQKLSHGYFSFPNWKVP